MAVIITQPIDKIRVCMTLKNDAYKNSIDCAKLILKKGGVQSFYTGI